MTQEKQAWLYTVALFSVASFLVPIEAARAAALDGLGILFDAGYSYDSNVTQAGYGADVRSDNILNLNLTFNKAVLLSEHTRLALSGFAEGKAFANYSGLDQLAIGAEAEYQYRPSGEFSAPTFGLVVSAARDEFRSNLRKSNRYAAGFTLRQPMTDRINLFAALKENSSHSDNDVFDTRNASAQLNLDYGFQNGGTLYVTGEYRNGDIVSSVQPMPAYREVAAAFIQDDVFTSGQGFRDYRLKGKTAVATLGYNLPLEGKKSLDVSWRYVRSSADYASPSIEYTGNQFFIDYLLGF